MGRTMTPAYRVECTATGYGLTPMAWHVAPRGQMVGAGYGKPTTANLEKFVADLNASFQPGGVNPLPGCRVVTARIVRQSDGQVMARYPTPAAPDRLQILVNGEWANVKSGLFRSWCGKRRKNGLPYIGPVYVFGTDTVAWES